MKHRVFQLSMLLLCLFTMQAQAQNRTQLGLSFPTGSLISNTRSQFGEMSNTFNFTPSIYKYKGENSLIVFSFPLGFSSTRTNLDDWVPAPTANPNWGISAHEKSGGFNLGFSMAFLKIWTKDRFTFQAGFRVGSTLLNYSGNQSRQFNYDSAGVYTQMMLHSAKEIRFPNLYGGAVGGMQFRLNDRWSLVAEIGYNLILTPGGGFANIKTQVYDNPETNTTTPDNEIVSTDTQLSSFAVNLSGNFYPSVGVLVNLGKK